MDDNSKPCEYVGEYTGEAKCLECPVADACMQLAMAYDDMLDTLAEQKARIEEQAAVLGRAWKEGK